MLQYFTPGEEVIFPLPRSCVQSQHWNWSLLLLVKEEGLDDAASGVLRNLIESCWTWLFTTPERSESVVSGRSQLREPANQSTLASVHKMSVKFHRIRKYRFVQLLIAGVLLYGLMRVYWEELDYRVVSHIRAFLYHYLVNSYDFSHAFAVASHRHFGRDASGMKRYPYLINHPDKCADGSRGRPESLLLLLFVKSLPQNFERRQVIRDTWGNASFAWSEFGANIRMLFALGVHHDARQRAAVQRALRWEDQRYGDLIQRDFTDTFLNLTIKLILQYHWGHRYCPQAQFFMSADDDVFIHVPNLVQYLRKQSGARDLWVGHVYRATSPIRYKKSKYHIPEALYPWPSYPEYTSGAGYVVSADVVTKIYQATLALNSFIYIDDVFMGICAKTVGVSPQDHAFFSGDGRAQYHPCIFRHMITSHRHTTDMRFLWKAAADPTIYKDSGRLVDSLYCTMVKVILLCRPHYVNTYPCKAAFT